MFNLDSSLGITVQNGSLILASVKKGFQEYSVTKYLIVEAYRDRSTAELHDQIRKFVKSNGFSRENIVFGFPRDQVVVRQVELPAEVEENLEQVIAAQVDRFEPSEEERSYYDFLIIDRDEVNERISIQIVMVRKPLLEEYLALLRDLDLYPAAVRYTSIGLQSILLAHKDGHPKRSAGVILDLNEDRVEIIVINRQRHLFSKSIPTPPSGTNGIWLLNEVNLFIAGLEPRLDEVVKIYLAGESAETLVGELRSSVEDCELLVENLSIGRKGIAESTVSCILPAVGMALSGIGKLDSARLNLIPDEARLRGGRPSLVATYVLVAALVISMGGLAVRSVFQGQALLDEIEAEVQRMQVRVDEVFKLRDEVAERQAAVLELQEMMSGRQRVLVVLRDLTERIPDDSYLTSVQIQGKEVPSIQGFSDQASDLQNTLLQSEYLDNVKSSWINKDARTGKDRFNFSATIKE